MVICRNERAAVHSMRGKGN